MEYRIDTGNRLGARKQDQARGKPLESKEALRGPSARCGTPRVLVSDPYPSVVATHPNTISQWMNDDERELRQSLRATCPRRVPARARASSTRRSVADERDCAGYVTEVTVASGPIG